MKRQNRWGHPGLLVLLTVALGLVLAPPASAVSFDVFGTVDPSVTAHIDFTYTPTDTTHGSVMIVVTNNNSLSLGGAITVLAFNVPTTVAALDSSSHGSGDPAFVTANWSEALSQDGLADGPFGNYDAGAGNSVFPAHLNDGSPSQGIHRTYSGTFTFNFSGTGMNALTADSFLSLNSTGGNQSSNFYVRFQGLDNTEGSDRAICDPSKGCHPPQEVPEPSTLLLLGAGLMGLARRQVRR